MLTPWESHALEDLLTAHGLDGASEDPFPNDGWSGAQLTLLRRGDERFVLKRTSWALDWIARATRDHVTREAFVASGQLALPDAVVAPYLGAAADGSAAAMLMPDLTGVLHDWERPIDVPTLDRVLDHLVQLHAAAPGPAEFPWCPLAERIDLLSPASARRYRDAGLAVGDRFVTGWDAFDRHASPAATRLVTSVAGEPSIVVAAALRLPAALLHGDLKLANLGFRDGAMALIDWQMVTLAPVAVDLAWFLVSNVAALPLPPFDVVERYRVRAERAGVAVGDWSAQLDLVWIVGLVLRGWRKGLDTAAGSVLASGVRAADDLAWWCERAVAAAERRL